MRKLVAPLLALSVIGLAAILPVAADAREGLDLSLGETVDIVSVHDGQGSQRVRALDNTDLALDVDFAALIGWQGARGHVYVLANHGARPNERFGSLEGFDNIEVSSSGIRLFEFWIEQDIGRAAVLAGLLDLNSEFYVTEAAGGLLSPPFGIGTELAGSGSNGPSIFPTSALSTRIAVPLGENGGYLRAALSNAKASTLGDSGGLDFHFREGVLAIAEVGIERETLKLGLGGWLYSKPSDHLTDTRLDGTPLRQRQSGGYALGQARLLTRGEGGLDAFVRAGVIAGEATAFRASAQAGVMLAPVFDKIPSSQLSFGVHRAWTTAAFHELQRQDGTAPSDWEGGFEISYSQEVLPRFSLQPDLQIVEHAGGIKGAPTAFIAILRLSYAIE